MTKYYYDCPIKAGYMAKYFGVRYKVKVTGGTVWVTFRPYDMMQHASVSKVRTNFYVAKESKDIFDVRIDDFVIIKDNCLETTMRDNKHFFMPEIEVENIN